MTHWQTVTLLLVVIVALMIYIFALLDEIRTLRKLLDVAQRCPPYRDRSI